MSHSVLFAVAPQLQSFTIEGSLLEESFENPITTGETHGALAQATSRLDPSLEYEVSRMQIRTHVVVPGIIIFVHTGDDGVGGRIGSWGETSRATSSRVVSCRRAGDDTAVEVAMGPVASLEVSWHGDDGGRGLSMKSLIQGVGSFIHH